MLKFGVAVFFTDYPMSPGELGVARGVFNLESQPAGKVLPKLDAIGALMAKVNG
jgi:hypothetical protein